MNLAPADSSDWPDVQALLLSRGLPIAGAEEHLTDFLLARDRGHVLAGVAGLEVHGAVGLLRSVAVRTNCASKGLGNRLTLAVLERARALGLQGVYLLTTAAAAFFERRGFEPVPRKLLPSGLAASRELQDACPVSATAMCLRFEGRSEVG